MDYGHKMADKELKRLEKRLKSEYKKALSEIQDKANAYFKQFQVRDSAMLVKMNAGEITYKEYIDWRKGKMFINSRYQTMVQGIAKDLTNVNVIASQMTNQTLANAYAINYNYAGYEICKGLKMNISFDIVDHATIERLIKGNPRLLPKSRVKIPKDQKWNAKKVNSALVQGILQGDSIPHIANRLQSVTNMNRNAAIRNARTMTTGAESAGRQARYEEAEEMGIEMEKMWIATPDNRTRDWHIELDGETVDVNDSFENEVGKIRYPGDPEADPENVYNCRCTMVTKLKKIQQDFSDRWDRLGNKSYNEWKQEAEDRKESREQKKNGS